MSMLRRPHDHHRDLHARRDAAASPDSSDEHDQDRYLMTTPTPRSHKLVRSLSWFATSRDSSRSNIQASHQFAQQSPSFDPTIAGTGFVRAFALPPRREQERGDQ